MIFVKISQNTCSNNKCHFNPENAQKSVDNVDNLVHKYLLSDLPGFDLWITAFFIL